MKIAIDAGHGMSNINRGVYDPGAIHTEQGVRFEEAALTLTFASTLAFILEYRGVKTFLTRTSQLEPCPVWTRAPTAQDWGAEMFVSLHLNSAKSDQAHGSEIQYKDAEDKDLADFVHAAMRQTSKFSDHGNDARDDLSVLKFKGPAILIELGFLPNDSDREYLIRVENQWTICRTIASALMEWYTLRH